MLELEKKHLNLFKEKLNSYAPISEAAWKDVQLLIRFQQLKKGDYLLQAGQIAKNMHFICSGVFRTFYVDNNGNQYNKNLFPEGFFPASKVSLITQSPSTFTIEALESAIIITYSFIRFKELMNQHTSLKDFYIAYIEKNWIVEKEKREVAFVTQHAKERYLQFLEQHPNLEQRVAQHHIASHLGITPTQLSRIRKELNK